MDDYDELTITMTLRALGAVVPNTHYNPFDDTWSAIDKSRLDAVARIGRGKTKRDAIANLLDLLEEERSGSSR